MGRPTALNDQKAQEIIDATLAGVHVEVACAAAGIARNTYYLWQTKGKRDLAARAEGDFPEIDASHTHEYANLSDGACWCGHTRYSAFVDRLFVAEARAETRIVAKVQGAISGDPRLALYFMERRWPSRWARRDRLSVSTETTEEVAPTVTPEPLQARLAKTLAILDRAGRLPNASEE